MAALSDYLESALLNHLFRSVDLPKPSSIAVALTSDVPKDSDNGTNMPELPSGITRGELSVDTNYRRINLGNPVQSGDIFWKNVGVDDVTTFQVYGTSDSGVTAGLSGYFYPLYLNESTALNNSETLVTSGFMFKEFPSVTFYAPMDIVESGKAENPGFTEYEGNGFIKNNRQLIFNAALTDWGWVSGVAIVDSSEYGSGNVLMFSELSNPRYVYTGDNIRFDINSLEISLQ
jgi:hypothetical protein